MDTAFKHKRLWFYFVLFCVFFKKIKAEALGIYCTDRHAQKMKARRPVSYVIEIHRDANAV